jgi:kynurenine formamidase
MSRYLEKNDWRHFDLDPFRAVSVHTAPWLHAKQIAAIAADNYAVEAFPPNHELRDEPALPLHELCLFRLGVHLGELWWLSELAAHLRARGRSRFLLTAPPLRLPGAAGSPVTPIATV